MGKANTVELTQLFEILAHQHRRYVFYYLKQESGSADLRTLATTIATWAGGGSGTSRAATTDAVETALYHTHLPKLVDAGFVTFDKTADTIELTGTNGLEPFLAETAPVDGDPSVLAEY